MLSDAASNKIGQINKITNDLSQVLDDEDYLSACQSAGELIAYIRLADKKT